MVLRHAMRNALMPVVTIIGLSLGALLGGAVLTETIFGLSGVGRILFDAIQARDYTIVQGFTLVIAVVYVIDQPARRSALRVPRSARPLELTRATWLTSDTAFSAVDPRRGARARPTQDALRALFRTKSAIVGMVILVVLILVAIFAPVIAPYDPNRC